MARSGRRFGRRLLRTCLLAWPRRERERDGAALLEAVDRVLDEAEGRPFRAGLELLAECAAVLRAGVRLRLARPATASGATAWTGGWWRDVRYALRTLGRSPGFSLVVVVTLAVGIGANAAVFGIVDEVLLQPPPYERPEELLLVWSTAGEGRQRLRVPGPDAAALRESATSLSGVAFTNRVTDGALEDDQGAVHVRLAAVTGDFFQVLGVDAALGRGIRPTDGTMGPDSGPPSPPVIVLSDALWRRAYGADPGVIGRTLRLNGRPAEVVGVLPSDFQLLLPPDAGIDTRVDVWVPLPVPLDAFRRADGRLVDQDSDNSGAVVARLAPGETLETARRDADRVAEALRRDVPGYALADRGFLVRPLHGDATGHARGLLRAIAAGVALVLLVACLNVSTMFIARGTTREQELRVRTALGATRADLARQLLAEGLVLVTLGGALALVVAFGTMALGAAIVPEGVLDLEPRLDARALAFTGLVAAATALLFGLLPALRLAARDRRGGSGSPIVLVWKHARLRSALVVGQVSLSVVLIAGSVLLLRSVAELGRVDPGFEPDGALAFHVALRVPERYRGPADRSRFMSSLNEALRDIPGVTASGLVGHLPLAGRRWAQAYGLPGQPATEWSRNRADFRVISSGYFEAMGADLVEGRAFTREEDVVEDRRVVIVDERLGDRIAAGGSAVGTSIGIPLDGAAVEATVVGVVRHIRHETLVADSRETVYVPYRQEASRDVAFVVRVDGDPLSVAPAVRRAVRGLDPQVPLWGLRPMEAYVEESMAPTRFGLTMLGAFAFIALVSAALGLYGVVSFEVARRTRDLGVRMALGASRAGVLRSVLLRGARMGATGLALGVPLALAGTRVLRSLVFGVAVTDPAVWASVTLAVATMTLLASWLPALRASRLDPGVALEVD